MAIQQDEKVTTASRPPKASISQSVSGPPKPAGIRELEDVDNRLRKRQKKLREKLADLGETYLTKRESRFEAIRQRDIKLVQEIALEMAKVQRKMAEIEPQIRALEKKRTEVGWLVVAARRRDEK